MDACPEVVNIDVYSVEIGWNGGELGGDIQDVILGKR
jgi:hypothetical protein